MGDDNKQVNEPSERSSEPKKPSPEVFRGHEFEAVKCRFENQTEQLYRMTMIDLRVFSGYITIQLALAAWASDRTRTISQATGRVSA